MRNEFQPHTNYGLLSSMAPAFKDKYCKPRRTAVPPNELLKRVEKLGYKPETHGFVHINWGKSTDWAVPLHLMMEIGRKLELDFEKFNMDRFERKDWTVQDFDYGSKKKIEKQSSDQSSDTSPVTRIKNDLTYDKVADLLKPNAEQLVSGKALHSLDEKRRGYRFHEWREKMLTDFGITSDAKIFASGEFDHLYTIDAAKMISMTLTGQVGQWARQYFLECERLAKKAQEPKSAMDTLRAMFAAIDEQDKRQKEELDKVRASIPTPEVIASTFNEVIKSKAKHSDLPGHLINYDGLAKRLNYAVNELVLRDAYDKLDHPRGSWVYLDKNGDPRPNESFEKDGIGETELMFLHSINIVGMSESNYIGNSKLVTNSEGKLRRFYIKRDVAENDPKTWERIIQAYHDQKVNPLKPCKLEDGK